MTAPCAGQWNLFDSTDYYDHRRARQLCVGCPIIDACRAALEDARATATGTTKDHGPSGTWAGQLIGKVSVNATRIAAEEGMFSEAEARACHSKFANTPRHLKAQLPDRVRLGERVYQRRSKRGVRSEAAA